MLGGILLVCAFFLFGAWTGKGIAPQETLLQNWWKGIVVTLSLLIVSGSLLYFLIPFTKEVCFILALLLIPITWWIASKKSPHHFFSWLHKKKEQTTEKLSHPVWIALCFFIFCVIMAFMILSQSTTFEAIRSPWQVVSPSFFLALFLAFLLLFALFLRGKSPSLLLTSSSLILFCCVAVALFVYPLGYGFDSFIHQATEEHIALFGSISPKPFYYTGQYVTILFIHQVFFLPLTLVDQLLVPLLAALLLPLAWFNVATMMFKKTALATMTLIGLFLLPLTSWIVTTPQGFANLWILLSILFAVPFLLSKDQPNIFLLFLLAFSTLLIHPIAGLPLLLFVILLCLHSWQGHSRFPFFSRTLFWMSSLIACIILPLSFALQSFLSGQSLHLDLTQLSFQTFFSSLPFGLFLEQHFHPLLDATYLFGSNLFLLILVIAVFTWLFQHKTLPSRMNVLPLMALALLVNIAFLSTVVNFSFLIDYERLNYADRLLPLIVFFLVPFFLLGMGYFLERLQKSPFPLQATVLVLLAAIVTSNIYLTYPRDDAYITGHGINVSQSDVDVIYLIDEIAKQPYVVLANQSVSAAAIRNLGFDHYFGDQYFYPIPTGETFYHYFLNMNNAPTKETALEALGFINALCTEAVNCDQEQAQSIFYVVDRYWWESARIIETAKGTADAWLSVGDGEVYLFRFDAADAGGQVLK
ncbi:TPA: hypothetical protein DDZ01_04505 [Candidatus Uhrbacteria bacterium]|nr:MAG: hypothetical protein A2332_04135 [Candidatus Uhrbacteria bacterium RIFOXYB2_FULL_41_18]HBK35224.1 hypothetical protein [Candidatus Uhrbacteria bacterium]HCB55534.1 hypothetical protein [Candidatus Uhrbacteria bacterium]